MKKRIVLFTNSYPYDSAKENSFYDQEIIHLKNNFDEVIIVPLSTKGISLINYDNVKVEKGLSSIFDNISKGEILFNGLASKLAFNEFYKRPILLLNIQAFIKGKPTNKV